MLVDKLCIPKLCLSEIPYAFSNDLTIYKLLCRVLENQNNIVDAINDNFITQLNSYMEKYFNSIMINAVYLEEEETIRLSVEEKIEGKYHEVVGNNLVISG